MLILNSMANVESSRLRPLWAQLDLLDDDDDSDDVIDPIGPNTLRLHCRQVFDSTKAQSLQVHLPSSSFVRPDEQETDEDDAIDPIGRNTLKFRSRQIVRDAHQELLSPAQSTIPSSLPSPAYPDAQWGRENAHPWCNAPDWRISAQQQELDAPLGPTTGCLTVVPPAAQEHSIATSRQPKCGSVRQWVIDDSMMHQPWGAVLRTLNTNRY